MKIKKPSDEVGYKSGGFKSGQRVVHKMTPLSDVSCRNHFLHNGCWGHTIYRKLLRLKNCTQRICGNVAGQFLYHIFC